MTDPEAKPLRRKRRALRRSSLWLALALVAFLAGMSVAAYVTIGRSWTAPDWLRQELADRLSREAPGYGITFGDVSVQLRADGVAELAVQDVDVTTDAGEPVLTLSNMLAGFAPEALIRGKIAMRELAVSGTSLTLRRDRDGKIALSFGDVLATGEARFDLPTLIAGLDSHLDDPRFRDLRQIASTGMIIRYEDVRARRAWTVDGGTIELTRDGTSVAARGDFAVLAGGDSVARVTVNASSPIGASEMSFGIALDNVPSEDIGTQTAALAWLEALRAPISGALRATMAEDGTLGALNASLTIGEGVLQPNPETRPLPFKGARTYFTYQPETTTLRFDEIWVDSPWGRASAEGRAVLMGMENGIPDTMLGQFTVSDLLAKAEGFLEAPVSLSRAEMDFRLGLKPFRFTLGQLYLDDPLMTAHVSGDLQALQDGWKFGLDAGITHATRDTVLALWPSGQKPKTRRWVETNVLGGVIEDAVIAVRAEPDQKPLVYLDAGLQDASVRFVKTLPPITEGVGRLTLFENRLVTLVDSGEIDAGEGGPIEVGGSSFIIPDVTIRQGPAQARLQTEGTLTATLALLDHEPVNAMKKSGLPVSVADGRVALDGTIDFALRKGQDPKDILFDFAGTATDVRTDRLVPNRTLAADRLAVAASNTGVSITGRAQFDGVPVDGTWTQPLGQKGVPSRVEARVMLSQGASEALSLGVPKGLVSGQAPADLTLVLPKGAPPSFMLTSDLDGLGASLPQVGWSLAQSTKGTLVVEGVLDQPARIDRFELSAGGLSAKGDIRIAEGGGLDRMRFDNVRIGTWFDAPVTLTGRGAGQTPAVTVSGGTIDLRRASFASGGSGGGGAGGATPLSLSLNRLDLSDGIALTGFRGEFSTGAGLQGRFSGAVNGEAPIQGAVERGTDGSAFRITSGDAGAVLRAAGFFPSAKGGEMDLVLVPRAEEGTYDGSLTVGSIRLQDAPAIGSLLDAISIVGLLDQLEGPGIQFSEVDATFRLTPSQLILSQSSAVGPSLGISLDGFYTLASKTFDMQGVVSPIYLLNGVGEVFGRKGEGLFGFNFTVQGTADDPKVGVNPFSVLTPGMFREIFRRPPPKLTQ